MTQNIYNPNLLKPYLKQHPNADNKELYDVCHATTKPQQGYIRKKKSRILQKKQTRTTQKNAIHLDDFQIDSLTTESLEQMVIMRINGQLDHISDSLIRTAADILLKLKGTESEGMEELDMEQFLKYETD